MGILGWLLGISRFEIAHVLALLKLTVELELGLA